MNRSVLRVEVIIYNGDNSKVLVQCDENESFYRFPGGSIEFSETKKRSDNKRINGRIRFED